MRFIFQQSRFVLAAKKGQCHMYTCIQNFKYHYDESYRTKSTLQKKKIRTSQIKHPFSLPKSNSPNSPTRAPSSTQVPVHKSSPYTSIACLPELLRHPVTCWNLQRASSLPVPRPAIRADSQIYSIRGCHAERHRWARGLQR